MTFSRLRSTAQIRLVLAAVIATSAMVAAATTASAGGHGIYLDYALGGTNPDSAYAPTSLDTSRIGVGYTFDSAVATDKLFNYRMNLGYENYREKFNDVVLTRFHGASFENIFGFGVYRTPLMRVWIGPSIRIAGGSLDRDFGVPGTFIHMSGGGGVSTGINVHTGNFGSAAFTLGYQFAYQGRFLVNGIGSGDFHGTENRVNFNFAYYFRGKGDRFEK